MKLIKTIVLTEVAGDYIAVPVGEATNRFNGVVRLNKTGRDIVQGLIDGLELREIAEKLVADYDGVDFDTAWKAAQGVADKLRAEGLLTD